MFLFFYIILDDIQYIDHEDGDESVVRDKSHENESLTTSVSDNTFYDTDGGHKFQRDRSMAHSYQTKLNVTPPTKPMIDNCDAPRKSRSIFSDCASTAEDISFYDDQSGALQSVFGREFHSMTPFSQSSGGAYHFQLTQHQNQNK